MKTILFLLCAAMSIAAQYELKKTVVTIGGGDVAGGSYSGTTTVSQPAAGGFLTFGLYSEYTGFWAPDLVPTAGGASIAGRVFAPSGAGLSNATIYLTTQSGEVFMSRTSNFGYYQFDDVEVGQTVIISIDSKRYVYSPRTVNLRDNLTDIDFLPVEGKH